MSKRILEEITRRNIDNSNDVFCLECGNRDQYTCQKHIVFEKAPISYTFTYISCLIKNKNNDCPDFTTEIKVYPLSELIITEEKNLNNGG